MEKLFINLSNHPHSGWSEKQLQAVRNLFDSDKYTIMDINFPNLEPSWDETQLEKIIEEYFVKIENIRAENHLYPYEVFIHLMGEMNFCFGLISALLKANYNVLASTTKRNVIETENGKVSKFEFERFRRYRTYTAQDLKNV